MDGRLTAQAIRREIREQKAAWKVKDNPLLRLSRSEEARHLGVIPDYQRLNELRALPKLDMARVIAESRGMRLYQRPETDRPRPKPIRKRPMPVEDPYLLDERIFDTIQELVIPFFPRRDWRNVRGRNNVTSVKDQGGCGACVSFGATATLESMILIEHNVSFDLSEAELLFCGGGSCNGWWPDSAVTYLLNNGVAHETCFSYVASNMPCTTCGERDGEAVRIARSTVIWDDDHRKQYLCYVGPTMCVFEVYGDFFGYASGVYSHVTGASVGLHCVEVIGYDNKANCWICKNSWGSSWGDGGFFRIAYGECKIDSEFPFWGISRTQWFRG